MKINYILQSLIFVLLMSLTLSANSESKLDGENQNHAQLPSGVTQDWLSNTRDESGNKIFSYNESFPGQDNQPDIPYNLAMTGEATNNSFGNSVSGAGDVNNDGYSDVIVGAYGYSSARGRAYIFFGGSPMNNVADVTLTGELDGNNFGWSVSSAGDVNNDGYSDVIVGASGYSSSTGRAYIFLGGSPMNNVADVIMTGETTNNSFGTSVSTGGDVNGDGYSDVIVGASSYFSFTGRAYIYFGSAFMDNTADVIMTGELTNNDFGTSVSSAGDVNGDLYSDVIVGASNYSSAAGRAYIYFGGIFMNNVADVFMTGEGGSSFGTSVSKAGNVNGDGYDDVIVGARGYSSSTGRAYIFQGGSPMNNAADVIMTGEASSNFFGWAVSTAGDINLDGYTDVIVGSPGYSSGTFTGRSYLFYGGASMNNLNDGTMTGEGLNHSFGRSVSAAGDLNFDGSPDLIVGASFYNSSTGRAYIYLSPQPTTPASALKFDGVNDYVSLPNQLITQATTTPAITIEYWFKGSSNQSAVRFQPTGGDFIVAGWLGLHIISTDGGTANGIPVGAAATDGNWHHIAMTWQKNTVNGFRSYLDGNLVAQRNSANVNLPALNSGGFIGSYQGTQEFMNGSIDEVRIWQRALTQSEIQTLRNCEFTGGRLGLIAYYKFNHGISGGINTGTYLLGDFSGNFYYGTLNNFTLTGTNSNWVSPGGVTNGVSCGVMASGLNFDGVNDNVFLYGGLGLAVSATTAITIEYWYKGTNNQSAVRFQEFVNNFIVAGWNGKHIISTDGGTIGGISQGAAATNGQWHHIAMTWQKNTVNGFKSFLDGQLVEQRNSANVNLPPFTHVYAPTLGSFDGTQEYMSGTLDNVRIWNRALSQAEIQFRMFCETPSTATGLIANYHFNQGLADSNNASVTVLNDATGNSYNGQLFNFALNGSSSNWVNPGAVVSGNSCFAGLYAITAVPEGFYDPISDLSQGDTVRVYLRTNTSPYGIQDSARAKMDPYWLSAYFVFTRAGNGTYYLQLKHRNSIETWSKSGGEVYNIDVLNSYDFTTSSAQAFGNNMKQVDNSPVRFAIYGGDVNQDGTIDLTDIILCYNDANLFTSGYVNTDLTGDDFVDLTDITIAFNNSNNFVSVIRP